MVVLGEEEWNKGIVMARVVVITSGPGGKYEIEMRSCTCKDGMDRGAIVVYNPFEDRLMWFRGDHLGELEARSAFMNLLGVALCDVDAVEGADSV